MKKALIRKIRNYLEFYRIFSKGIDQNLLARKINSSHEIKKARFLQSSVYLDRGFILADQVGKNGLIKEEFDRHIGNSAYFVVQDHNNAIIATARLIENNKKTYTQPILHLANLYPSYSLQLKKYNPSQVVEASALAKVKGRSSVAVLYLFREMYQYSLHRRHKVWLMACDVRLYERLKTLFGPAVRKIGRKTAYFGGDVIPAAIQLDSCIHEILSDINPVNLWLRKRICRFFISGLDEVALGIVNIDLLRRKGVL
ncbi:hypothetical protein KBC99_00570 [Candidatus Saccharibacteria bacterium]|nr:hypothetical protein [Candidatus Saccharibacteria bacterium]